MHSFNWTTVTWLIGTGIEIAICVLMIQRRLYRAWPSIFFYCALSLSVDILITIVRNQPGPYYYTYWAWMLMAALLRLWVLGDVIGSFPGMPLIALGTRWAIGAATVVFSGFAWRISLHNVRYLQQLLPSTAETLSKAVALAWGALLICILFSIWFLRLAWVRDSGRIATGLVIKIAASVFVGYLLAEPLPNSRLIANIIESGSAIAAVTIWYYALRSIPRHEESLATRHNRHQTEPIPQPH